MIKTKIIKNNNQAKIIWVIIVLFAVTACNRGLETGKTVYSQDTAENTAEELIENTEEIPIEITAESSAQETRADEGARENSLPEGFVYLTDIVPDVVLEIRYFSTYNFMGTRVDYYLAPVAIITRQAAQALALASKELRAQGYVIKVFDAYRPQGSTDHFIRWGKEEDDITIKSYFYPDFTKSQLFSEVYLGVRSGHTKGSTIDLTIIDMKTGMDVDMGSSFDFFGLISHHGSTLITEEQTNNRLILKTAMERAGFRAYEKEWWHYTLINEPFPSTYFTFPVQ